MHVDSRLSFSQKHVERRAFDVLHHAVRNLSVTLARHHAGRQDIRDGWMLHTSEQKSLTFHPLPIGFALGVLVVVELDGHRSSEADLFGFVDSPECPPPYRGPKREAPLLKRFYVLRRSFLYCRHGTLISQRNVFVPAARIDQSTTPGSAGQQPAPPRLQPAQPIDFLNAAGVSGTLASRQPTTRHSSSDTKRRTALTNARARRCDGCSSRRPGPRRARSPTTCWTRQRR